MDRKYILAAKVLTLLCIFILFYFLIAQEFHKAQLRTLNYLMPSSYLDLLDPKAVVNQEEFNHYIAYYKVISALSGGNAEADAMLGICYSRKGEDDKAINYFEKALSFKSSSFWIYYDLGVIYLKKNNFFKTASLLTKALGIQPQTAFKAVYSSKIYIDIISVQEIQPQTIASQLVKGYQNAYQMQMLTQQLIAKRVYPQEAENLIRSINVQIF